VQIWTKFKSNIRQLRQGCVPKCYHFIHDRHFALLVTCAVVDCWQYEEEIKYLKVQIEAAGGQLPARKESSTVPVKTEAPSGGGLSADVLAGARGNALLDLYARRVRLLLFILTLSSSRMWCCECQNFFYSNYLSFNLAFFDYMS
jgi:hypothetical protein